MKSLIFIANALDPIYKLVYITWYFKDIYEKNLATNTIKQVKNAMVKMYEWYVVHYGQHFSVDQDKQMLESQEKATSNKNPTFQIHTQNASNAAFRTHLKK